MVVVRKEVGPQRYRETYGRYFEDFEVGGQFPTYGRTITEGDLSLFCSFAGYSRLVFQFLRSRLDICLQLTDHLPVGRATSGLEPRMQAGR